LEAPPPPLFATGKKALTAATMTRSEMRARQAMVICFPWEKINVDADFVACEKNGVSSVASLVAASKQKRFLQRNPETDISAGRVSPTS
jgi:hypothetical protein